MSDSDLEKDLRATRRAARETVEAAGDTLRDAADRVRARAGAAGEEALDAAATARMRADEALHAARDLLAEASSRLAARLDEGVSAAAASRPVRQANAAWGEVSTRASRSPGLYMAGAAVAGFALALLLRGRPATPAEDLRHAARGWAARGRRS